MSPYVPYFTSDSSSFYDQYYKRQAGEGLQVYRGRRHLGRQSGAGIGSLFSGLMRAVAPTLKAGAKSLAKRGLAAAANVAGDIVRGDNFGASAKKHFAAQGKDLLGDVLGAIRPDAVKAPGRKRKRNSRKQRGGKISRLRETIF